MQEKFAHRKLFDRPHPRRSSLPFHTMRDLETVVISGVRLIYGTLARLQPAIFTFGLIATHFQSIRLIIDISDTIRSSQEAISQLPIVKSLTFTFWCRSLFMFD
jgi:hypothetical protein